MQITCLIALFIFNVENDRNLQVKIKGIMQHVYQRRPFQLSAHHLYG